MINNHISAAELVYSYSCSGSLAFRHNLNIPLRPGSVTSADTLIRAFGIVPLWGAAVPTVTAATANTFTVSVGSSAAGAFTLIPTQMIGDYS